MPIGSDPAATCPVILKTDEKAPDPKPTFHVRFLTDREMRKATAIRTAAHEADKAGNEGECDAKLSELFRLSLDRWENVTFRGQTMERGKHEPADFLTSIELWELANQCIMAPQVTEVDRRNFTSPSPPDGAKSADVPAASVKTPQAPPNPSA